MRVGAVTLAVLAVIASGCSKGPDRGDGATGQNTFATVVDTRSGAVTELSDPVTGVDGGTIAIWLRGYTDFRSAAPAVVRTDALPALTC